MDTARPQGGAAALAEPGAGPDATTPALPAGTAGTAGGLQQRPAPSPGLRTDAELSDATRDDSSLRRFLRGLPGIDPVGLEQRAAGLATRSIKKNSKLQAIDLAISMVDLTTLEGADTPGKVRSLAAKARRPDPAQPGVPSVAAVCVYPDLVAVAAEQLAGSGVGVASVATAFPSGRAALAVKLADVRSAVDAGATEIDMVIDRGAFLAGRFGEVFDQIVAVRQACAGRRLKVILETGELGTYDNVRRAAWLALLAGGDFVKTSTGKVSPAATLPVTQVLLQAVADWHARTGEYRAVKPAGGIRTTKDAVRHLVAVNEVAGPAWLDPYLFRFGASSLLNDLLLQRRTQREGHYSGPDYVTVD
ncbi:deoxyribose-phosphate aldolase [Nakamurella endophytica]|uniref:Deoxyribose-phosphate aldolase n=1 Tax=Nakamurella endophytica TaxID=1748367 RepID=A0A917SY66_9ACTN|nr:deoxyribose-phosphate aldolase [Nakamurella endophytica]GGM02149.1 2-deoxyribose-5-phosphate aldolase [Nakamurella endophytica]